MKALFIAAAIVLFASASYAQTSPHVYADFAGGFAAGPDGTSGDTLGEVGVWLTPRLAVFGDIGQFHNLQPSLVQPAVANTDTTLADGGLMVNGTARVPAWYSMGGVRYSVPVSARLSPYVFGSAGFAHLTPSATFTYSSGTLIGATVAPNAGDDVTSQLTSLGDFTPPPASTAFMFAVGGGVETPIAPHVVADIGYRISRISADTPINAQSVTFGIGYRF